MFTIALRLLAVRGNLGLRPTKGKEPPLDASEAKWGAGPGWGHTGRLSALAIRFMLTDGSPPWRGLLP